VGPRYRRPELETANESHRCVPVAEQRTKHLQEVAAEIGIEPEWREYAVVQVMNPPTGTIPCITLNEKGEMSAAVSTSGLAWKIKDAWAIRH